MPTPARTSARSPARSGLAGRRRRSSPARTNGASGSNSPDSLKRAAAASTIASTAPSRSRSSRVAEQRRPDRPDGIGDEIVLELPDEQVLRDRERDEPDHGGAGDADARPDDRAPAVGRDRHRPDQQEDRERWQEQAEEADVLGELHRVDAGHARGQLDADLADVARDLLRELRGDRLDRRGDQPGGVGEVEQERVGLALEELGVERSPPPGRRPHAREAC